MAPTHYAGAVIHRKTGYGIEFLIVEHHGQRVQTKFPGGTNEEYLRESVEATLRREMLEETGLTILKSREILDEETEDHTKYGFLINIDDCRGQLRTGPLDDEGVTLAPPRWATAKVLLEVRMPTFHQTLCRAACRELRII